MAKGAFDSTPRVQTIGHRVFVMVGRRLEVLSLTDGRVLHERSVHGTVEDLALVGGRVWLSVCDHQDLAVYQYTTALRPTVQIPLGTPPSASGSEGQLAPGPDGDSVLVSDGTKLLAVSVTTGRVTTVRFSRSPGEISEITWLSASPSRIAVGHRGPARSRFAVYRLINSTARPLATIGLGFAQVYEGDPQGIAGSPARVYLVTSTGHADQVSTLKVRNRRITLTGTDSYLSGESEVDYSDHEVWIGGFDRLACADPRTGHEVASTRLVAIAKQSQITTLTTSHGSVVVLARIDSSDTTALVTIRPPAVCRR